MKTIKTILLVFLVILAGCTKTNDTPQDITHELTIFFVNDVHAQIDDLSKVKHIVDAERAKSNVLVVSSGDMFSGNPVVDNAGEKGYPMIDLMNRIGFDMAVIGNHEFDYGTDILNDRIEQSDFPWLCANLNTANSTLPQPSPYATVEAGDLRITFLGLLETAGAPNRVIPSTHPGKIEDITFFPPQDVVRDYMDTKNRENADLFIALSHLGIGSKNGSISDFQLAAENYFFDLIIGGHTHAIVDTTFSNIPIYQAGGYLNYLGRIDLTIKNRAVQSEKFTLIDLDKYPSADAELQALIDQYNDWPELHEVIGHSLRNHSRSQVGCFYTDALREYMGVDVAFQNSGGVRAGLPKGDITKKDIFGVSPFNNGTLIYQMTVAEIKEFLIGSESGFYYSGIIIGKKNGQVTIADTLNRVIPDDYVLSVGINDYIPAVHSVYFPDNGVKQPLTAAETLIAYLGTINNEVDYDRCNRYFRY